MQETYRAKINWVFVILIQIGITLFLFVIALWIAGNEKGVLCDGNNECVSYSLTTYLITIMVVSVIITMIVILIYFQKISIDSKSLWIGSLRILFSEIQTIEVGDKIIIITRDEKKYEINHIKYRNGHLIKLNLKMVEHLIYGVKNDIKIYVVSPLTINDKVTIDLNSMKYRRSSLLSFYNWGVIILGTPFVLFFFYLWVLFGNVILFLLFFASLLFTYIVLVRDNYYFILTSGHLLIKNSFNPWKEYSYKFEDIASVKNRLLSLVLITTDYKCKEFRATVSSKMIADLIHQLKGREPKIICDD